MIFRSIRSDLLNNDLPQMITGFTRFSQTFPAPMIRMSALKRNRRNLYDIIEFYGEFVMIDNDPKNIKLVIPKHQFVNYKDEEKRYVISDKIKNFKIGNIDVKLSNPMRIGHVSKYPDSFVCDVEKIY